MKISEFFEPHTMPAGALDIRCHVLPDQHSAKVQDFLIKSLPECYITSEKLKARCKETGLPASEMLAQVLPDPGSVMSGDFGEIFTMFFLSSERVEKTDLIKKWCYKQDRRKAAPHSDVVIFHRTTPGVPSEADFLICGESKQKSTKGTFDPISSAIEGYRTDQTGRLGRTLSWLRERALLDGEQNDIQLIERFTTFSKTTFGKFFKALAIVERSFLDSELIREIELPAQDKSFEIIVLGITDLKAIYENVFERARKEAK